MNEASKLTPFLAKLRERMPHAVVVKHRDVGMVGLPDFSITYRGHVVWCEAKLYPLPKRFDHEEPDAWRKFVRKAKKESPEQAAMMERMNRASASLYVIWIKKTAVVLSSPFDDGELTWFMHDSNLVERIARIFDQWDGPAFPSIL